MAIEIDDEGPHNNQPVASGKFYDDLLKHSSMVHLGWEVYRWAVRQLQKYPEQVKDELQVFLGNHPRFKEIEDSLPTQKAKAPDGTNPELKEHQKAALKALEAMRDNSETIISTTAVPDAKRCGGRVLFIAHTQALVDIFNWQEDAAGMISQMEFVRRVEVQTETIERYVREGKRIPDLVVPMSEYRTFR